jgi:dihydroorotase
MTPKVAGSPLKTSTILLTRGTLVDPGTGVFGQRDLFVCDGLVKAIAPSLAPFDAWKRGDQPLRIYDLEGHYLFPGLVDIHTHLRVPGQEHKESLVSGTRAAAAGGFTSVLTMPNTKPCLDRPSVLRELKRTIAQEAVVRVHPVGAVTRGQKGRSLAPLEGLKREGAVAFSDDGLPVVDARLLREAMQVALQLGLPIVSHCEDDRLAQGGAVQEGRVAQELGVQGIPNASEDVMTARDLTLARDTGAHLHLAHVSTAGSIEMIRCAKDRGIRVTSEVTPHHLHLNEAAVLRYGTNAKMNPPLRAEEDRLALLEALRDGTVEAVASDHAPHHPDEKALPMAEAPFGVIGLETTLPLMISLVHQERIGLEQAVKLLTTGPAEAMGLDRGTLQEGGEADLVVVAIDRPFRVDVRAFRSKARNCPFDGWSLKGQTLMTMVGGQVVYEEQEPLRDRIDMH